jgi:hypothetical protein
MVVAEPGSADNGLSIRWREPIGAHPPQLTEDPQGDHVGEAPTSHRGDGIDAR